MAGHESGACDMQQASILDYRDPAGNLCVCVRMMMKRRSDLYQDQPLSRLSYFLELEGVCGYQNYCNQGLAL